MTPEVTKALEVYVRTAIEHGEALKQGDYKRANPLADRNLKALRTLKSTPDQGKSILARLLHHESLRVRGLAAADLLDTDMAELAVPVLEAIALDKMAPAVTQIGAEWALKEWRAGKRRPRA